MASSPVRILFLLLFTTSFFMNPKAKLYCKAELQPQTMAKPLLPVTFSLSFGSY